VSTLSSTNFTDGNILLTEHTHKIKITYSRSAVHKLGHQLIAIMISSTLHSPKITQDNNDINIHDIKYL